VTLNWREPERWAFPMGPGPIASFWGDEGLRNTSFPSVSVPHPEMPWNSLRWTTGYTG
jgi:hypothetical protein